MVMGQPNQLSDSPVESIQSSRSAQINSLNHNLTLGQQFDPALLYSPYSAPLPFNYQQLIHPAFLHPAIVNYNNLVLSQQQQHYQRLQQQQNASRSLQQNSESRVRNSINSHNSANAHISANSHNSNNVQNIEPPQQNIPIIKEVKSDEDAFKFRFASSQLSLLVEKAENILQVLNQRDQDLPQEIKNQIDDWLCRKEESFACIASVDVDILRSEKVNNDLNLNKEAEEEGSDSDEANCSVSSVVGSNASSLGSLITKSGDLIMDSHSDEEEEEGEEGEEDEEVEELVIEIDSNFKSALNQKISDAEDFYDQPSIERKGPCWPLDERSYQLLIEALDAVLMKSIKINQLDVIHEALVDIETQTEIVHNESNEDFVLAKTSFPDQEDENGDIGAIKSGIKEMTIHEDEIIREEISKLRISRETLVTQRKELADKIKKDVTSDLASEKKVFEFEEAVECIDSVIEFKNEIICGRNCVLTNNSAPGKLEANLISRLNNLTLFEIQRLFCLYFDKVIELRYSTKKLEKNFEDLEASSEKMKRVMNSEMKHMEEIKQEYQIRIESFLNAIHDKDMKGAYKRLEDKLEAAKRKQYDLERSLTELLVRHGYLINGADYDVKQVVRNLGIDTAQLGLNWQMGKGAERKSHFVRISPKIARSIHEVSAVGFPNLVSSRRMAIGTSGHHHDSKRSGRSKYENPEYEAQTRYEAPAPEVRREKNKLIIKQTDPHHSYHYTHGHADRDSERGDRRSGHSSKDPRYQRHQKHP